MFSILFPMVSTTEAILPELIVQFAGKQNDSAPCYVYISSEIKRQCQKFSEIPYPHVSVHFATMANAMPDFLRIIRESGLGVFINTIGHLKAVEKAGFSPEEIIFTASASSDELLKLLGEKGITVNLDSLHQVNRWRDLFPKQPFGIRCNIGDSVSPMDTTGGVFLGSSSRLGLDLEEIRSLSGIPDINGLHLYVGTNILEMDYFLRCYNKLLELVNLFPGLEYIDLGGGFGVDEDLTGNEFDFKSYGEAVTQLFTKVSESYIRPLRIVFEPGRVIGASAGFFVSTVTDIKYRDEKQLVGVNASSAQFPRPLFYPEEAVHPAWLVRGNQLVDSMLVKSAVYGCSTYSRDYLSRSILLPQAMIGDKIILGNAGAYCNSAHTQFLGFEQAAEYYM